MADNADKGVEMVSPSGRDRVVLASSVEAYKARGFTVKGETRNAPKARRRVKAETVDESTETADEAPEQEGGSA